MKTKFGFPLKKSYTVKELAENLLVGTSVLQNYLYKKGMVARLTEEYKDDALLSILESYSKVAYMRKNETIERANYLIEKIKVKPVVVVEDVEASETANDVLAITEGVLVEEEVSENQNGEDLILKVINVVSMISALIGIYKELNVSGVISLGFITCLFLIYTLKIMSNVESGGLKKFIACLCMLGVEFFWCMFHVKTFEGFDSQSAIFGMGTSFITALVVGALSFTCLLLQAFKNE